MASLGVKRGRPRKSRPDECHEADEKLTSPPFTRSKRSLSKKCGGPNRNRDGFPLQCETSMANVTTDKSIMGPNNLVDMESVPNQPAQSRKPHPDVVDCGHRKSILESSLLERIQHIVTSRGMSCHIKFTRIESEVRQFRGDLEEVHNADIATLNHAHGAQVLQLKLECQSWQEKVSVEQKEKELLQKSNEEVNLGYKIYGQEFEAFIAGQQAGLERLKKVHIERAKATQNSAVGVKPRCKKLRLERGKKINSDRSLAVVDVKLQKSSGGDESSEKSADGDHNIQNAISGFYADGAPKPTRLNMDMSETAAAVATFHRMLLDSVKTTPHLLLDCPAIFLVRPNHSSHYFKSLVMRAFFEGFEDETFGTRYDVSRFPDPNRRQEMFYDYYLRERDKKSVTIEDPQFEEFCEMKVCSILCKIIPSFNKVKVSNLEELGGPDLVSSFKSAAKCVWLLHKLAFSFERPATVLTVEEGADWDPKDMKSTIVTHDQDERSVPKVGFMIDPGLRLNGETIVQCEVYLAKGPTPLPDLNERVYHRKLPHRS